MPAASRSTGVPIAGGTIHRCTRCLGYYLVPPVVIEYSGSSWSELRERGWEADAARGRAYAPRIVELARQVLGRPVQTVLELGCGTAYMGKGFEAAGCRYTGVEIDAQLTQFARSRGLHILQSTAEALDLATAGGSNFDLVISSNAFEHVQRPRAAFGCLAELAGGVVFLIVPNAHGFFQRLKANTFARAAHSGLSPQRSRHCLFHRRVLAQPGVLPHHASLAGKDAGLEVDRITNVSTNDPTLGFVQPNADPLYRILAWTTLRLGRASQLLLVARPPVPAPDAR